MWAYGEHTGLSQRFSSLFAGALCPSLHCPPAGYVSGPDRLPDSGIYLGEQGKCQWVIPHTCLTKPVLFFSLSLEPFASHDDRHNGFCAVHHPGERHYHTMLSYQRKCQTLKKRQGNPPLQEYSKFTQH